MHDNKQPIALSRHAMKLVANMELALSCSVGSILHTTISFIHKHNGLNLPQFSPATHNDVIKWKHFLRYWPSVRGTHRSPVNSPHKGQWRGALMLSLICAWINGLVNNRESGDLRRHWAHYDVIVMNRGKTFKLIYAACSHCPKQIIAYVELCPTYHTNRLISTLMGLSVSQLWGICRSTLAQVMACCLMAPTYYMNRHADLSSIRSCAIRRKAITLEMLKKLIIIMHLKIAHLESKPHWWVKTYIWSFGALYHLVTTDMLSSSIVCDSWNLRFSGIDEWLSSILCWDCTSDAVYSLDYVWGLCWQRIYFCFRDRGEKYSILPSPSNGNHATRFFYTLTKNVFAVCLRHSNEKHKHLMLFMRTRDFFFLANQWIIKSHQNLFSLQIYQ